MRSQRLESPAPASQRPLRSYEGPDPLPNAGEVRVRVHACAVCRTDLQICEGDLTAHRLPIVPGHQVVGTIDVVGDGVDGLRAGDRVGVAWIASTCGVCRFCTSGRENLCVAAEFTGWDRDGGYATHVVSRADFVHSLPPAFDDVDAAPLLCGGVIGYRALKVAEVAPGSRLGLYGFGASATSVIQVATHWGCEVFVVTRSGAEQRRALDLGAVWAGGPDQSPPSPLDAAITFAPVGEVVVRALGDLDRGGIVAVNAIHLDRIPEFDYERLWWERQLRSVANVTREDVREFLVLAADISINSAYQVTDLEGANDALDRLSRGEVRGTTVLVVDP